MKQKNTFLFILFIVFVFSNTKAQDNWSLSMTGFDQTYSPNDFVTDSNGDVYVICSKYDSGINGYIPKLYKSINQGNNWNEINTNGLSNLGNTHSITISGNTMILAGMDVNSSNGAKIFTSTDNGINWTLSMNGFDTTYSPSDFVTADNGDIYINGVKYDSGIGGFVNKLYKSTNQGNSWSEINTNGLTDLGNVHSITISGNTMILAGMDVNSSNGAKIFTSTDNGINWTLSMNGFDTTYSPSDFVTADNGNIYINGVKYDSGIGGFVNKLYKSTNQGNSWSEINTNGLADLGNVHTLTISGNKMILAGMDINSSNGAKIFTSDFSVSSVNNISFSNFQFYPNPVNDILNIKYKNSRKEILNIRIVSLSGQEIYRMQFNSNQLINNKISFKNQKKGVYLLIVESLNNIASYIIIKH